MHLPEVQVSGKAAVEMSALSKDIVLFISHFLDEEGFKEAARMQLQKSPLDWLPSSSSGLMINDLTGSSPEKTVPCFAVSKNDSYLLSARGGRISLYSLLKFKTMLPIMQPPAATRIAFYTQDNNVLAIGRDDSTILIYNVDIIPGHSKRASGLAFSNDLNVLVSSGADAQIFFWKVEGRGKERSRFLLIHNGRTLSSLSLDTDIQSHQNQTEFLAWSSGDSGAPISHATFSCDGQMVHASFEDGVVSIFDASDFQLYCRINPTSHLSPTSSLGVYPLVAAAHPPEPDQFAAGLKDGAVIVFEPPISAGKWSMLTADENGSGVKCLLNPKLISENSEHENYA